MNRKPISKRERFAILQRHSFTCVYCGARAPDVRLELDHAVPLAAGGPDDALNLVPACVDCNAGKADKPFGAERLHLMALEDIYDIPLAEIRAAVTSISYGPDFGEWLWHRLAGKNLEPFGYRP